MRATVRRAFGAAVAASGAALTVAPEAIADPICRGAGTPDAWIVRALGLRQLVQGLATVAWPRHGVLVGGAVVDGTHAASMVALAAASPRFRRAALASAAVAGLYTGTGSLLSASRWA